MANRFYDRPYSDRNRYSQRDFGNNYDRGNDYPNDPYDDPYYDRNFDQGRYQGYRGDSGNDYNRDRDWDQDWRSRMDRNYQSGSGNFGGDYNRGTSRSYNRNNEYRSNVDRDYGRNRGGYSQGFNRDVSQNQWDQNDWEEDDSPSWVYTEYWFIPGPYEGIGPEDYQRSDENIKEDINNRLTQHGRIHARDIRVDVKEGEVTLKGSVQSRDQKRMAEDVALSVSGVEDVHNEIRVNRKQQGKSQGMQGHEIRDGQVRGGMKVVGKNGNDVGTVKEILQNGFKVDRGFMNKDVVVPFQIAREKDGQVMLDIRADQVDNQNWSQSPIAA